jgi:predicted MFS family arabinose efflux permease
MDVSVGTAQWMLTINLLVGAVATPVMGRLSDGPHKKKLLLWALLVILLGSVIAALAPNFTVFLIGLIAAAGLLLWFAHSQLWEILAGMLALGLGMAFPALLVHALITRFRRTPDAPAEALRS